MIDFSHLLRLLSGQGSKQGFLIAPSPKPVLSTQSYPSTLRSFDSSTGSLLRTQGLGRTAGVSKGSEEDSK